MASKSSSKTESRKLSAAERRELKAKRKAERKEAKAEAKKLKRKKLWDRVRGAAGGSDIVVVVMVLLFSFFGIRGDGNRVAVHILEHRLPSV